MLFWASRDNPQDWEPMKETLSELAAEARLQRRKDISKKTRDYLIRNGKFPSSGLKQINDAIETGFTYYKKEYADNPQNIAKLKTLYKGFSGLLLAAFYTSSPQGRVLGIITIPKAAIERLNTKDKKGRGVVYSTMFKTRKTYGYQPIIVDRAICPILDFFLGIVFFLFFEFSYNIVLLEKVRPTLSHVMSDEILNHEDSFLIPSWGLSMTGVGHGEIQFFLKKYADLAVGSNLLRSLMEIEVDKLYKNKRISLQEKESVNYCYYLFHYADFNIILLYLCRVSLLTGILLRLQRIIT